MSRLPLVLIAAALTALAAAVLSPGLDGGFLFDDYVNLNALGDYGGVRDWPTLGLYLTSALGDPLGRPLSKLSFLLNATNWPAAPQPFLLTNILLHLCNGLLLTRVLYMLGLERRLDRPHAARAALVGANIWVLHPFFLSTTLYVVQREAMLGAMFTLLGMWAWLAGRRCLEAGLTRRGLALLGLGALGCTALAALCKANGLLLPLLLLVAEATVLRRSGRGDRVLKRARALLLVVPVALLALALLVSIPDFIEKAARDRPWSIAQRLLTEPRVLVDYLTMLLLPHPVSHGVFHDDFAASTGLFDPWSTAPCLLLVTIAIASAWRARARWPALSFAVLFFFAAHAMESSFIPLELYFEHRNYLPAMMIFWPCALWLARPRAALPRARLLAAALVLAGLAADSYIGARIWGHPQQLALAWADRNPDSARAQAYAAQYEVFAGNYVAAQRRLTAALGAHPDETQLAFNLVEAQCAAGAVATATIAQARHAAEVDNKAAALDFVWLRASVERARAATCAGFTLDDVASILDAVRRNPRFAAAPGRVQDFEHIAGLIALARNDAPAACAAFDRAVDALPQPAIALQQAALLGSAGRPDLALQHLDGFSHSHRAALSPDGGWSLQALHGRLLDRLGYWQGEFARMRAMLIEQQESSRSSAGPSHADPL